MERFLYRLSLHAHRFVLKGALMLHQFRDHGHRPTWRLVTQAAIVSLHPDVSYGLRRSGFYPCITEGADYDGVRIRQERIGIICRSTLGSATSCIPQKSRIFRPLDFPAPRLLLQRGPLGEFEAMIKRYLNSWMKDFYDIWLLSRLFL